jgi:hypothetical protein
VETASIDGGWTIRARGSRKYNYFAPGHSTAIRSQKDAYYFGLVNNLPFSGRLGCPNRIAHLTAAQTRYRQFLADAATAATTAGSTTTATNIDTSTSNASGSSASSGTSAFGDVGTDNAGSSAGSAGSSTGADGGDGGSGSGGDGGDGCSNDRAIVAAVKGYVQHLPRTINGNFVKRHFAAACASSSVPLIALHERTGLSREVLRRERDHQTSTGSLWCSLRKPHREQRSDRLPAAMERMCWELLHDFCKPDNLRRRTVLVAVPGSDPDNPQPDHQGVCVQRARRGRHAGAHVRLDQTHAQMAVHPGRAEKAQRQAQGHEPEAHDIRRLVREGPLAALSTPLHVQVCLFVCVCVGWVEWVPQFERGWVATSEWVSE